MAYASERTPVAAPVGGQSPVGWHRGADGCTTSELPRGDGPAGATDGSLDGVVP